MNQLQQNLQGAMRSVSNTVSNWWDRITGRVPENPIAGLDRVGSALRHTDPHHAFPNIVDNFASLATRTPLNNGGVLYQLLGSLNGTAGRFEWIVQGGQVTHRFFVPGGILNGIPIR